MAGDILTVWLHGRELGELEQLRNGRLRLRFTGESLRRYGIGAPALSLSLPVTPKRVEGPNLERFLDNLLPESQVRGALERQYSLSPGDTFGLLKVVGRECAGAIQLTPVGHSPGTGYLRELTAAEANAIVRDLPTLDPPDGLTVGASLGGVQAKVLLSRIDGAWAWPADGAMSTHLIKPEPSADVVVPGLVRHEEWAMRLAAHAGLPAATVSLADFDGRLAIVVERYDRNQGVRTHQEDFAQALGIAARDKYESSVAGTGRLGEIATRAAAESTDPDEFRRMLLRIVAFNTIIGNGDAHSKNYSLHISPEATFSLAPIYDAAPVFLLNPSLHHAGHAVAGQVNLRHITAGHLVAEAESWGVDPRDAHDVVLTVCAAVQDAVGRTEADAVTSKVADLVRERASVFEESLRGSPRQRADAG